ncbi:uncharacterized protein [Eurosta solidaginis]|uniref:uncharacterized protein n=1 Tax=Eurosta solidaginis TaxID=178769 RepID=UPI003531408A
MRSAILSILLGLYARLYCVHSATHDELPQCGLTGVYKTRQSIIESPNYPNNYPTSTCWDYVIRSPYRCPTKFHIQFLDFHLETSNNCTNDYLAIGLENDDDDMDLLCGQVIGIKKYHTPDGILRLRFFSDASPWTTARGFKLLITRLACERDDYLSNEDTEQVIAPSLDLEPPHNALPEVFRNLTHTEQHLPHPTAPLFGWNIWPEHLPVPPAPPPPVLGGLYASPPSQQSVVQNIANRKPCLEDKGLVNSYGVYLRDPALGYRSNDVQKPQSPDQYVGAQKQVPQQFLKSNNLAKPVKDAQSRQQFTANAQFGPQIFPPFVAHPQHASAPIAGTQYDGTHFGGTKLGGAQLGGSLIGHTLPSAPAFTPLTQQCCNTAFNRKRFYLSSPGFPRTAFTSLLPAQQRDCVFELEKYADNICRLRIEFKFFHYGHAFQGTGDVRGNVNAAIGTSRDVCTEDYLEIDGERFCGCRTGYIYISPWLLGDKKQLRMRMGYSGIPSNGFLLNIYQEECRASDNGRPALNVLTVAVQANPGSQTNLSAGEQEKNSGYQNSTTPSILNQQQLPLYQQPPYFGQPFYHPLQTPNINPFLPPHPTQFLPSTIPQTPYAGLPYHFDPYIPPVSLYRYGKIMSSAPRVASTYQPQTAVETNSTRKGYYYFDGDDEIGRLRSNDEPNDIDRNGIAPEALMSSTTERNRCTFSTMHVLCLTVDSLWITKPTCYAPLRSWFSST